MPKTPRANPEHNFVRLPLLDQLCTLGWDENQLQWSPEWHVPKTPSDASKREAGRSFEYWPVDIAVFDSPSTVGNWEHVKILIETKAPSKSEGQNQLEIYLSREPRAKAGWWTNGEESLGLYRRADGSFEVVSNATLPRPGDTLEKPAAAPLVWSDLQSIEANELRRRLKRLLDQAAISDTKSTRVDDRLNHLCNLILVKLDSDKQGKASPAEPLVFQPELTDVLTERKILRAYNSLKRGMPAIFDSNADASLDLDAHTIHNVVFELSNIKLMDISVDAVSEAFQVFRLESLKSEEGQYFTPHRIIKSAVAFLEIGYTDKVIDPACGTGGFLLETFRTMRADLPQMSDADMRTWAHDKLFGVDKDRIGVKLTRAIMQILGDGSAHIQIGDSLRAHMWEERWPALSGSLYPGQYTVVVTNPPFGEQLTISARDAQLANLTLAKHRTGRWQNLEVGLAFLDRAYKLLDVGGRIGIILPETYFFSSSYEFVLDWIQDKLLLRGMLNIPMEAFQGFCRAKTNFYVFEKVG